MGFLQGDKESLEPAKSAIEYALKTREDKGRKLVFLVNDVKVKVPLPQPGKMICVGYYYREHILKMKHEIPPFPVVFAKFANTVIGPQVRIPFSSISK
ncbi:hypothetical protein [Bacillus sp. EB600]|uniref:hypothetical protein n=1 Tax=Bacillus sp. EB600 TaxID=2806345 RepID=UPI00210D62EA|nr:hypothetical protein [Bacillus sp. EB600]MCQ6282312.1 hypothetical protein [Bacillus sp. EB600]